MIGGGKVSDAVRDLAEALAQEAPLKLWSVLVTCLGDVSRTGVPEVSGVVLSTLTHRIGLQPQAMRVALHRLKRDGWVESRREGRVGFHGLSGSALAQTYSVEGRIYGPAAGPVGWHLVGLPPDAPDGLALLPEGVSAIAVSRSFALVCGGLDNVPEEWLVTDPSPRGLPTWVRDVLAEAACEEGFAALERALRAVAVGAEEGVADKMERFALRVLVLHGWRRLVLRSNVAAEAALGPSRAEVSCRAAVHAMLDRLGPPQIDTFQVAS